ncbi:cation-transporting P-type ATPase [Methylomarinum sp. Ch1-1]|uniref:Cation-transporting P-type ATPase n=1 Tax=Methylomarinum roseum TaxID=3067653 RepID=A0AAU7NWN4_9GAMM|nr:cation-transporting P-type ATPase [Methylomarinum sp. Ch1-1]MDP4522606.1 cation-transporting P-type ATPase [Methylomarinum sp. Ch1-1]
MDNNLFDFVYRYLSQPQVWPWWVMSASIVLGIVSAWATWQVLQWRQTQRESQPKRAAKKAWHALDPEQVLVKLNASESGLAPAEVSKRQRRYGLNRLPESKSRSAILRFFGQFHNLLIYVLLIAALITYLIGHIVDSAVIVGVVLINGLIGFIQEGKAENALRAIRNMLSLQATVMRGGKQLSIAAEQLVPGDIVLLQSGDKVPADLRLLKCRNFRVQEAVLTGESLPVEKQVEAVERRVELGDRVSMAYSGTLVSSGQATGVVVASGGDTEIGLISALVAQVETLTTPLLKQLAHFGRWLTAAILLLATGTFLFGFFYRGYPMTEMFMAAVGLAVAAIPEGLPAIMTITLAIGVQRMADRHAIIRRLPAVETLGSVTVICSDKTGTLTRNEMTVGSVLTAEQSFSVSGVGYNSDGGFQCQQQAVEARNFPVLQELARAALLCNDAVLHETNGEWTLQGDPTEVALLAMALKAGLKIMPEREKWPRTDVIPFESEHRFMATLHHDHAGQGFTYIKGAPERLLEMCTKQRNGAEDGALDRDYWLEQMQALAQQGQRLLAIAIKEGGDGLRSLESDDLESGLTLLGVVGMIDPPRSEAIAAVRQCQQAGIVVKMITGDHADTAAAISSQLGLNGQGGVLAGHQIEDLSDAELRRTVGEVNIFARSSPEHKLRLVKALQANGHVVAMTGDGVNDAPALKRADVGTAMGQKGTEAAKEAAEMVLTDDNFASLAQAVVEGRTVYDNLKKSILFILPTSIGEALVIIAAVMLGEQLPITPVQILWINMITTVTLALTLGFEPSEEGIMLRPPRNPDEPLLTPLLVWRILFVSLIMLCGAFGLFLWEKWQGETIEHARTVAINTIVMFEIFYLFNSRKIEASIVNWRGVTGNRYVLLAVAILIVFQLAFTYLDALNHLFGTVAIDAEQWLPIILIAFTVLPLVEIEKLLIRVFKKPRRPT